ncbi:MAG: glycosyltransferase [Bacteroides sp.]|nr:glycosyltransferase [Bacteroides sp.]MCM1413059.1 glycosyltransferase [Bacteroides sp.]MCM1471765.1 glycosyltransferase [Bacteroides sp.]
MKKILIVTKFYYRRGGDCIYALNLEKLLRSHGHEVAVFAMQYPENEESQWSSYWPSAVTFGGGVGAKLAAVRRTLGMGDVVSNFKRLMADFKPDVVHLNNIHSYLSPIVASIASKAGAKVVWTLHDYKLLCPAYSCTRDGRPCEICFDKKLNVVKTRCMKGSMAASLIGYVEALRWNRGRLSKATDTFVCPSRFMASKMQQGGFDTAKLRPLCNFLAPEVVDRYAAIDPSAGTDSDYYCYVGRLSSEKGVATLLEAASRLPYKMKVAGDGPLAAQLKERYGKCDNIEFLGRLTPDEVNSLLAGARLSVMPSECYENNPLGVIESLCAGTPVVGARIGGIPELIGDGVGVQFTSGDVDSLCEAVSSAWAIDFDRKAIQRQSLEAFSPDAYYRTLIKEIY